MTSSVMNAQAGNSQHIKAKVLPQSREDYSNRSIVAKAYNAGFLPVAHRILLDGIRKELVRNGSTGESGTILLRNVLASSGFHRNSALTMLNHLKNFGIIEAEPIPHNVDWKITILKDPDNLGKVNGEEQFPGAPVGEAVQKDRVAGAAGVAIEDNLTKQVKRFNDISQNKKVAETAPSSQDEKKESTVPAETDDSNRIPSVVEAGKAASLNALREEVMRLMGPEPEGLGLRPDEQEKYLLRHTGKRNINEVQVVGGLQRIISEARAELAKRIEEGR